jgi:hypothetical protein
MERRRVSGQVARAGGGLVTAERVTAGLVMAGVVVAGVAFGVAKSGSVRNRQALEQKRMKNCPMVLVWTTSSRSPQAWIDNQHHLLLKAVVGVAWRGRGNKSWTILMAIFMWKVYKNQSTPVTINRPPLQHALGNA